MASKKSTVTLAQLAKGIARDNGITQAAAKALILNTFEHILIHAAQGHAVSITGYGRFAVKQRAARTGRSPVTGKSIKIKASRTFAFRASKTAKDRINPRR